MSSSIPTGITNDRNKHKLTTFVSIPIGIINNKKTQISHISLYVYWHHQWWKHMLTTSGSIPIDDINDENQLAMPDSIPTSVINDENTKLAMGGTILIGINLSLYPLGSCRDNHICHFVSKHCHDLSMMFCLISKFVFVSRIVYTFSTSSNCYLIS
jgi:hypothetical protein